MSRYALPTALPAEVDALPAVAALPAPQRALLVRAVARLQVPEMTVTAAHLAAGGGVRVQVQRYEEQGQVLLLPDATGQWERAVAPRGARTTQLTREAVARLNEPVPHLEVYADYLFADDIRPDLLVAYYRLQAAAAQQGWTMRESRLLLAPTRLVILLEDRSDRACGLARVDLYCHSEAAPLHGEVFWVEKPAAAPELHEVLSQLVGPSPAAA